MNHCKTIAIVNQKGGVGKTTSTVNLGVGLAQAGNRVLLVDDDPQHSLTISLGIRNADDELDITLATAMQAEIRDESVPWGEGIIHSGEGVDLLPANIELSGVEMSLFNAMSREQVLTSVLSRVKENYDYILIDCITYSEDGRHMTVDIAKAGLDEINGATANKNGKLYTGYSNYTARVTYSAVINADKSFVYGEKGNENTVILTWKRTSGDYYDTLIDDCHVFSFGLDLTKLFSDVDAETAAETKLYDSVKFKIQNKTDGTWIIAKRNDEEGVYYVTGHTDKEADATVFTPVTMGKSCGHIMVKGLEEDTYTITEIQTANGYTLLKNAITVTISLKENPAKPCNVYAKDVLGVLQNDPHYAFDGGEDLKLANIPQRALSHNYPTASATVDKNDVTMLEDNGSANAEVPLTVKNTKGFDLPKTGDHGTWMYSLVGILLMSAAAGIIVLTTRKKNGR